MDSLSIKIIGLGGIGSILAEKLARFLNFTSDQKAEITLIDGDEYEVKNVERQEFSTLGSKSLVKARDLYEKFKDLSIEHNNSYVSIMNVHDIIKDGDIVMLAVDNHKTRKIVSDFASTLENITIISGGNELTDGNIQIFVRKEGRDLTPNLTAYHPEIETPADKLPSEMTCEELANSSPQLFFTNLSVATIMCWAFYNVVTLKKVDSSEIYFDIGIMKTDSKFREVPRAA